MTTTTTPLRGSFTIDTWEAEDGEPSADGASTARVVVGKTFSGDLTGSSRTELITLHTASGPLAYVGLEEFRGSLAGRQGSFFLRHAAGASGQESGPEPWLTWSVVEGSGTGELTGVRGEGGITRHDDGSHSYTLEVTLS